VMPWSVMLTGAYNGTNRCEPFDAGFTKT